jgi:hypothetical protein
MAMLDGDIPRAMAVLERMSVALERYTSVEAPTAIKWDEVAGEGASMAQPEDDSSQESAESSGNGGPTGQPKSAQTNGLGNETTQNQVSPTETVGRERLG